MVGYEGKGVRMWWRLYVIFGPLEILWVAEVTLWDGFLVLSRV